MSDVQNPVVIYSREQDEPEEYPYVLLMISRSVWETQDEWHASYDDDAFGDLYDWVTDEFKLDPLMENQLDAGNQECYQRVLTALEADPRFQWVDDLYAGLQGD